MDRAAKRIDGWDGGGPQTLSTPNGDLRASIRDKALALGFHAVGFAKAALSPAARDGLAGFLAQGYHGDMGWLAAKADRRADPRTLWPEARSVVVLGLNYGSAEDPFALKDRPDKGDVSVYARNRDYHDVIKKRLKGLARWMAERHDARVKVFVDTAPVMEKPLAEAAGIGWQGKHTNLVSRAFGSWLFLGEVFTDLDLEVGPRRATIAGNAGAASTSVRPRPSPSPTASMPGAASPISPSSTRARSFASFARSWATASMVAMTASPSARGTSSRA
jgi:epoxyqueuosine reductase